LYIEKEVSAMSFKDSDEARDLLRRLKAQPEQFLFGLSEVINNVAMALITPLVKDGSVSKEFAQAHTIVSDSPGTGKTAMFNYYAAGIDAKLGRIDGRPDLMPSDFTGQEYRDKWSGIRTVLTGPLHSHLIFADEINRTPPKSQAPFLGAMEGGKVIMNVTNEKEGRIDPIGFPLFPVPNDPQGRNFCIVFATMNPIEFEGTFPLSEAQMERFTYRLRMGFPNWGEEKMILADNVMGKKVQNVMSLSQLLNIQEMVARIRLSDKAIELRQRYLAYSRPFAHDKRIFKGKIQDRTFATKRLVGFINEYVISGCSPRRNFHMEAAAKAHAFMRGEDSVATVDDMKAIAHLTMEHVIQLDPKSIGDEVDARMVVENIIAETRVP
jgi:MoxR-like ATPase